MPPTPSPAPPPAYPKIPATAAEAFATTLLIHAGHPPAHATLIAHALVLADLRGIDTHGLTRLPIYLSRLRSGALNAKPSLTLTQKTPVMAHLDADHGSGFVAAATAIDAACDMAATFGIGVVAVKNSGHYGMAAAHLLRAMERGFAAFAFTNAARSMPAWGSKEALLGTSPFAVGLPGGERGGFVLDMSPAVVARGKIRKAARRNESIPQGWALDASGASTTDPSAALAGGVVLPIGGPKGSGLAMMMDIFGGLLTGSSFAGGVRDQYEDVDKTQGVGHWFLVFRPEMFLEDVEEYRGRMDLLLERVRGSEKAVGFERIWTPGEIEEGRERVAKEGGVEFSWGEVEALNRVAEEWGCGARLVP